MREKRQIERELEASQFDQFPIVHRVIGAPGTGKTTRVVGNPELELDGLFIENGRDYSLDEQMLVTYTNAGVNEAKERLAKMIDVPKYKIDERVTTIHSQCYSLLNDDPRFPGLDRKQVVDHYNKRNFCNKFGLEYGWDDDEDDIMGADMDEGNALFRIYGWLQNNLKDLEEWEDCPAEWTWDEDPVYLMKQWEEHKQEKGLVGFGDMIEGVLALGYKDLKNKGLGVLFPDESTSYREMFEAARRDPDRDPNELRGSGVFIDTKVLYIDEVQDLTSLQHRWYLLQKLVAEKVYLGGDDDQTIYGWSGADPSYMLDEEGDLEVLETTYRIPREIWDVCDGVIHQVNKRQEKRVQPNGEGGEVIMMRSPAKRQLIEYLKEGEWMILFRARYQIDEFCNNTLSEYGIPYRNMSTFDIWDDELVKLRDALAKLDNGANSIKGDELHILMEYAKDDMVLHDSGVTNTEKVMGQFGGISRDRLNDIFQLTNGRVEVELNAKNFLRQTDEVNYYEIQAILNNIRAGNIDMEPERIRIGTIHSAKGKEAPNILLATDSTQTILENMAEELGTLGAGTSFGEMTDAERRVYYVGMTRASERLILAQGVIDPERCIDINCLLAEEHDADEWQVSRQTGD